MDDDKKVCEYSAGTESNPFFMFDMSAVESGLFNRSSTPKLTDGNNYSKLKLGYDNLTAFKQSCFLCLHTYQ